MDVVDFGICLDTNTKRKRSDFSEYAMVNIISDCGCNWCVFFLRDFCYTIRKYDANQA